MEQILLFIRRKEPLAMHLFRRKIFHFITISLFTGLFIHSWDSQDVLGWAILFLLIILNAILFIVARPVSMLSWITIVVGILGIIMSLPELVATGMEYLEGSPDKNRSGMESCQSALYFTVSAIFSYLQLHRTFR